MSSEERQEALWGGFFAKHTTLDRSIAEYVQLDVFPSLFRHFSAFFAFLHSIVTLAVPPRHIPKVRLGKEKTNALSNRLDIGLALGHPRL
jgi:hypothetical protein